MMMFIVLQIVSALRSAKKRPLYLLQVRERKSKKMIVELYFNSLFFIVHFITNILIRRFDPVFTFGFNIQLQVQPVPESS